MRDDLKERVREAVDIVDVVSTYISLRAPAKLWWAFVLGMKILGQAFTSIQSGRPFAAGFAMSAGMPLVL